MEPDDEVPVEPVVPELLELSLEPDVPGLVGVLDPLPEGFVDNGVPTLVRGVELEPEEESDDDEPLELDEESDDEPLELGEVELLPEDG